MILIAKDSVNIDADSGTVFPYTANLENFGRWFPGVTSIESENDVPTNQIGKRYREIVQVPFRGRRSTRITVVECAPARRIVTESAFAPLLPRMTIEFAPEGAGTRVDWRMESRNKGFSFRLFVLPLARLVMRRRAATGLANLKRHLEAR